MKNWFHVPRVLMSTVLFQGPTFPSSIFCYYTLTLLLCSDQITLTRAGKCRTLDGKIVICVPYTFIRSTYTWALGQSAPICQIQATTRPSIPWPDISQQTPKDPEIDLKNLGHSSFCSGGLDLVQTCMWARLRVLLSGTGPLESTFRESFMFQVCVI